MIQCEGFSISVCTNALKKHKGRLISVASVLTPRFEESLKRQVDTEPIIKNALHICLDVFEAFGGVAELIGSAMSVGQSKERETINGQLHSGLY